LEKDEIAVAMIDRETLRVLVIADDGEAVDDFRQLFSAEPEPTTGGVLGRLKAELFGTAAHHDDYPDIDLVAYRNGGEGVQAVRQALSEERPFAVAFIDMQLAPGLDWLQTAEQIRAWDPRAQIVMVAGYCDTHPMDICLRVPPPDRLFFVQKPFHALEVKQLVYALGAKWKSESSAVGVRRAPAAPEPAGSRTMLAAVQHHPLGAMVFDARDNLLAANPAFIRLFPELADVLAAGMTYEEVCRVMAERLRGEDTLYSEEAWVRDRLDWHSHGGGVCELRLGGERWVMLIERSTGQDLTYCHFVDVSEAKARERNRAMAAQMTAMAQAFAGICQRLDLLDGAPAGAAERSAALMQDPQIAVLARSGQGEATGRSRKPLDRKLLGVAQRLKLEPQTANLNRLVGELVQRSGAAGSRDIAVEVVEGAGLWDVLIDKDTFFAALGELLFNAAEALSDNGGRIVIEAANMRLSREFAAARSVLSVGEYVRVSVTDDGPGMSTDMVQRALNPFFSSKNGGGHDGLGLSFVYGFVGQSGGYMEIRSGIGEGTSVELYFPRAATETGTGGADVHVVTTRRRSGT
jgi:two-component system cell cycle sensor histidine kinase/response regulator CckA